MKVIKVSAVWCGACLIMNKRWKELKVSSFIINDETDISDMFYDCHVDLKNIKFIVKNKSLCYLF